MRSLIFAAGFAASVAALPALAQAPAGGPQGTPMNVRGTITKLSGQTLTLKGRDGVAVNIMLAQDVAVRSYVRKKLSDIHDGDYIASTSMKGKDGKLHAIEVHFIPAAAPELQTPWDLRKDSVMTNAHVSGMAKVSGGTDVMLTYKGNATDIVIDPKTVIVGPGQATMADLKPGKAVFIFRATKGADGMVTASNVSVEKNGVKPPM
ncbi:MAG TPA: hypothetical protein VLV50_13320 [Stellaceae bacterium]|nr:hypothetical protein [Stellaceae bacterium]